jgi:hypothetical protein
LIANPSSISFPLIVQAEGRPLAAEIFERSREVNQSVLKTIDEHPRQIGRLSSFTTFHTATPAVATSNSWSGPLEVQRGPDGSTSPVQVYLHPAHLRIGMLLERVTQP